jgi:dUTP pyrophosphatase
MSLYIFTENVELRNILLSLVENRRMHDSGFDIPMTENAIDLMNRMHTFNLDIKVAAVDSMRVPIACLLLPRSSIVRTPYRLANSVGLIDAGYRGSVKAVVDILRQEDRVEVTAAGTKYFQICQPGFLPWTHVEIVQFENDLPEAPDNRGSGGFGSTN